MTRQFSIMTIIVVLAYTGVFMAALINPTVNLRDLVFALTAGTLLVVILKVVVGPRNNRANCLGFTLFAWAYFFSFISSAEYNGTRLYKILPTQKVLVYFQPYLIRREDPHIALARVGRVTSLEAHFRWEEMLDCYYFSGHLASTLVFGVLGSAISTRISRRQNRSNIASL